MFPIYGLAVPKELKGKSTPQIMEDLKGTSRICATLSEHIDSGRGRGASRSMLIDSPLQRVHSQALKVAKEITDLEEDEAWLVEQDSPDNINMSLRNTHSHMQTPSVHDRSTFAGPGANFHALAKGIN